MQQRAVLASPVVVFNRLCFFFPLLHLQLVKAEPPPPTTAHLLQTGARDGDDVPLLLERCFNTP